MNSLIAFKYKIRVQWSMSAWYLVIYPLSMILVSFILIKTSVISENNGGLMYRLWGSVIFLFVTSMRFNEDFDFLLTLSHTRKDIYYSLMGVILGFSAFFSGLIVLERVIVDHLNDILGFYQISDLFHFYAPYAVENNFLLFLFFFMFCACCSIFGLMMGSLFYRFGKKFRVIFWLLFSSIPTVFLPLLLWALYQRGLLSNSMTATGGFLKNFDILAVSWNLLLLSIVFGVSAWLNIRRLPQK